MVKAGRESRTSQPLYSLVIFQRHPSSNADRRMSMRSGAPVPQASVTVISISVQHDHSIFGSVYKFRHLRRRVRQTILHIIAVCNIIIECLLLACRDSRVSRCRSSCSLTKGNTKGYVALSANLTASAEKYFFHGQGERWRIKAKLLRLAGYPYRP